MCLLCGPNRCYSGYFYAADSLCFGRDGDTAGKADENAFDLGLIPFVYYMFDYTTRVYTSLLYSGREVVVEFLGFILCVFYLLFIFLYFRQYEEKLEADQKNQLMELKRRQYEKELAAIRRSEREVSILRHDMRHFLLNLSAYIKNGESEKAEDYIHSLIASADQTATRKYCKNEIINIILSSHEEKIKQEQIQFSYSVDVPDELPFPMWISLRCFPMPWKMQL